MWICEVPNGVEHPHFCSFQQGHFDSFMHALAVGDMQGFDVGRRALLKLWALVLYIKNLV